MVSLTPVSHYEWWNIKKIEEELKVEGFLHSSAIFRFKFMEDEERKGKERNELNGENIIFPV